jgi:hypothetical protein
MTCLLAEQDLCVPNYIRDYVAAGSCRPMGINRAVITEISEIMIGAPTLPDRAKLIEI